MIRKNSPILILPEGETIFIRDNGLEEKFEMNYSAASYGVSEDKSNCFALCKTV